MAKLLQDKMAESKELPKEESNETPSLSFTENEVKEVVDFVNYFAKNHKYTGNIIEFEEYKKLYLTMNSHIKKIESYILEVKRISKAK